MDEIIKTSHRTIKSLVSADDPNVIVRPAPHVNVLDIFESPSDCMHLNSVVVVSEVIDLAKLDEFAVQWRQLEKNCRPSVSTSSLEVTTSWWRNYGPQIERRFGAARLNVLFFHSTDGELVGIFPTYLVKRSLWRLVPSQLISIGSWPDLSVHSMMEEPPNLVSDKHEVGILRALSQYISTEFQYDQIDFTRLAWVGDPSKLDRLRREIESGVGLELISRIKQGGALVNIRLSDSWAEHRRVVSRSMRDNFAYYPNLFKRANYAWHVRIVSDESEIPSAIKILTHLHRIRCKHSALKRHTTYIEGDLQECFLSDLFRSLAKNQSGYIAELVVNDRVVASQAFIETGDVLAIQYSGFDPKWRLFSPIFVLNMEVFKMRIGRGIRHLNFLLGDSDWKTRWGPASLTETYHLVIVGQRSSRRLVSILFLSISIVKKSVLTRLNLIEDVVHEARRKTLPRFCSSLMSRLHRNRQKAKG